MSFTNKVVIITGAGSGIGEATAIQFAKLSARLSLIDINAKNLQKVAEECENLSKTKVLEVVADISKEVEIKQAVEKTIEEFERIDVVVNCAGILEDTGILHPELLSSFDKVISVNLKSQVAMIHFAAPALIESKGCVVNIASVMATKVCKGMIPYNISKAAIAHFTRNVALELAEKGVRVNSISPGPVQTNIHLNLGLSLEENERLWAGYASFLPLKHNVQPVEIADMVVYLASEKARSITGADFVVDSGLTLSGLPSDKLEASKG